MQQENVAGRGIAAEHTNLPAFKGERKPGNAEESKGSEWKAEVQRPSPAKPRRERGRNTPPLEGQGRPGGVKGVGGKS